MKTKPDYCNECRCAVHFRYTGHNAHSVYARCVECGPRYDLINDGTVLSEFRKSTVYRMAFYLRKANDYSEARFDILRGRAVKKTPATRLARLFAYKVALYDRIKREAGVC